MEEKNRGRAAKSRPRMGRAVALTVAGSDSGGGAGIQADLKVFALNQVYGCAVVTGLTAQNTRGVQAVHATPVHVVRSQLDSVLDDLPVAAIKTGMLWSAAIVRTVAARVAPTGVPVVVDPVMIAHGGEKLLQDDAVGAVRDRLVPLATLVTPNLDETEMLLGERVRSVRAMRVAARKLVELGASAALVKGGHLKGRVVDVLYDGERVLEFEHPRVRTRHTHGTGCVLSASIAARLARRAPLRRAVAEAVADLAAIIARATSLGAGHGPADPLLAAHFGRRRR